jgi:glycosyltransferase involved in cell wall biosynthesis
MNKIKVAYVVTDLFKCGPIQQTLNNIKYLDGDIFEPYIITIYPEDEKTSQLPLFIKYATHIYAPTTKLQVMLNRTKTLEKALNEIEPDVIHSLGVFPDYAVSKIAKYRQVMTLRNYVWDDYPVRRGKILGSILSWMQLYARKRADKAVVCSKSLSVLYKERMGLNIDYVQNGVDLDLFDNPSMDKMELRQRLSLPKDKVIFTYTAPLIARKNHKFLIDGFIRYRKAFLNNNSLLLLLGDGPLMGELKRRCDNEDSIIFGGNILNVSEYLHASDIFISSSLSEGLPNSVLEAIASGIPVVLSDIPQHAELLEKDNNIGCLYPQNDSDGLVSVLHNTFDNLALVKENVKKVNINAFSAKNTSEQYQKIYKSLVEK